MKINKVGQKYIIEKDGMYCGLTYEQVLELIDLLDEIKYTKENSTEEKTKMILDQYVDQLEYNGVVKTLLENDVSFKTLLIHALDGIGTGTMRQSIELEKQGLAKFCGNQHNEDWCWTNTADLSCYDLVQLYLKVSTNAKTSDEIIEETK